MLGKRGNNILINIVGVGGGAGPQEGDDVMVSRAPGGEKQGPGGQGAQKGDFGFLVSPVLFGLFGGGSFSHLRAPEAVLGLGCRLFVGKKKHVTGE